MTNQKPFPSISTLQQQNQHGQIDNDDGEIYVLLDDDVQDANAASNNNPSIATTDNTNTTSNVATTSSTSIAEPNVIPTGTSYYDDQKTTQNGNDKRPWRLHHQTPQEYFQEDPMARKERRLRRRQANTVLSVGGGTLLGGIVLGPVGFVLGALGGLAVARKTSQCGERRKDRRMEQFQFSQDTTDNQKVDQVQAQPYNLYPTHQQSSE